MIPDFYDPVRQEETRQADWDRTLESSPRCGCCGESIVPGDHCRQHLDLILCNRCFSRLEDSEIIMEV